MSVPDRVRAEALRLIAERGYCVAVELRHLASGCGSASTQMSTISKALRALVESGVLRATRERDTWTDRPPHMRGRCRVNVYRPGPAWPQSEEGEEA